MPPPPLIATKFHVPPARADFIPRPRLQALLEAGSRGPLTLVSAPPGFGKSSLVAEWVNGLRSTAVRDRIAWLSLDESDDQPAQFWRYFVTALGGRESEIGGTALAMLAAPQPPPLETILVTLINELAALEGSLLMVVDDYHLVRSPEIHDGLSFLLDHQPASFHVVLLTREDPPLSLARRRARRQVTEIRAADLRFDEAEAAAFLTAAMKLTLTAEQVAALERRTEGWIVGLQMAALSLQGRDPQAFFDSFTGDDRYIADYLIEEVLDRQAPAVRDFLLRTSILEKLSAPLCEAVAGRSPVELADLERANLFLIPLDNTRGWYRYHHLFAELLRRCLRAAVPAEEIARSYRLASQWCEANDDIQAAVRYARQVPDHERVARLLGQYAGLFFVRNELPQLAELAGALPASLLERNPHLCMAAAWAMIATRQSAEKWLAHIESHYGMPAEAALSDDSLDDDRRAALLEVLVVRQQSVLDAPAPRSRERLLAMQARLSALPDERVCLANRVAALRPVMLYDLGFEASLAGDVERAAQFLEEAIARSRQEDNHHLVQIAAALLAGVQLARGRLREAQRTLEQALADPPQTLSAYTARAHAGLGQIFYEWGDLAKADLHFQAGLPMARAWNQWDALFAIVTGLARISKRRGDARAALALLDDFRPPDEALQNQAQALRLAWAGGAASPRAWPGSLELAASSAPTPFNEPLLLDVTRALLAVDRMDEACTLAQKVLAAAKEGGRNHAVIQADVLLSRIFAARGKTPEALARIVEALQLAGPEKYLSVFVDEGDTVRALLTKLRGDPSAARVLAGFASGAEPPTGHEPGVEGSFEALSEREREVLRLVAAGYSNQEIASRLVISITTVKTHVGNIFHKLGVTSRTQAVARAEALGLLAAR